MRTTVENSSINNLLDIFSDYMVLILEFSIFIKNELKMIHGFQYAMNLAQQSLSEYIVIQLVVLVNIKFEV